MSGIKRFWVFVLGVAFLLTACGPKEIPDDKMALIIHDLLILNAYNSLYQRDYGNDTIDIYSPVLEQYGYDAEDFRYSLDRMALRKSSRLSELIDQATADITRENDYYVGKRDLKTTLENLLKEYYRDTVYRRDTLPIRVTSLKKIDSLKFTIPVTEGTYRITYNYLIDSADKNSYYLMRFNVKDSADKVIAHNSRSLSKGDTAKIDVTVDPVAAGRSLEIMLADYSGQKLAPSIEVDSIYVSYVEPVEISRERYAREKTGFDPDKYKYELTAEDSLALHTVPPMRVDTARRSDVR